MDLLEYAAEDVVLLFAGGAGFRPSIAPTTGRSVRRLPGSAFASSAQTRSVPLQLSWADITFDLDATEGWRARAVPSPEVANAQGGRLDS